MITRLQRITTIGMLLAAILMAFGAWQAGWNHAGWIGPIIIASIHAGALAVEFAVMVRVNRADPCPAASARQLLGAWWGEVRSAPKVFCWRQPFRSQRIPDHLPADSAAAGSCGLLLVHGFVCNRGLWNPWLAELRERGVPFVAVNLEPPFGSIDEYVTAIDAAVSRLQACTGRAPIAVAHSMGGLALRRWWIEAGCAARLQHAITIGTPHRGTWLARFAFSRNGREMRPGSHWLQALQAREAADYSKFTCLWSHCDNIVFPASNATLAGADNRHLPALAHVHMVDHAPIRTLVFERLEALRQVNPARRG